MPEIGYQEVDLTTAFCRLNADVTVITSTMVSPGSRKIVTKCYESGESNFRNAKIVRFAPDFSFGPNVYSSRVTALLERIQPDFCILMAPGKIFGTKAFCRFLGGRRISIFQENSEDGRSQGVGSFKGGVRYWLDRFVRWPTFSRVVLASDRVVCNVPETKHLLRQWLTADAIKALGYRGVDLRLGFDPQQFFFSADERSKRRRMLHVADDEILVATCTRATRGKRLEAVMDEVHNLRKAGLPVRYVLAGVMDDQYGTELRKYAAARFDDGSVQCLSVLSHDDMSGFCSAADIGLWPQAAISIQQAMGTGLPIVLHGRGSVSHLLQHGVNGWYVHDGDNWNSQLLPAVKYLMSLSIYERARFRSETIRINSSYLSYDKVALEMISGF